MASLDRKVSRVEDIEKFKQGLKDKFAEAVKEVSEGQSSKESHKEMSTRWTSSIVDEIVSFGPKNVGANILLDRSGTRILRPFFDNGDNGQSGPSRNELESSIINGFQLATLSGPLCEEPMMGVAFIVTSLTTPQRLDGDGNSSTSGQSTTGQSTSGQWTVVRNRVMEEEEDGEEESNQSYGPLAGQLMSTVKEGCRKVFLSSDRRLKMAMFTCTIQVSQDALGQCRQFHLSPHFPLKFSYLRLNFLLFRSKFSCFWS